MRARLVTGLAQQEGAIADSLAVVMAVPGVTEGDLVKICLAGPFGSYINPHSVQLIGLAPLGPVGRIKAVGNLPSEMPSEYAQILKRGSK